ncbi:uncharacterized protein LOC126781600 [Nymphalis io]|uniref:uncharacterized protein LOC126781600 n=1 Tax=Inachis io TaxID=171585 RepID=UPI0021671497|nr:uncharacterized protein LOC126781600 [Nymphalis io]
MKIIALFIFIAVLSAQLCISHPTADSALTKAATDAGTTALDAMKEKNPLEGISNSTNIIKEGTIFITTVISAAQHFMKNVIKQFNPNSTIPGLDNLPQISSLMNPAEMAGKGKDVMDNFMKMLSASPLSGADSLLKAPDAAAASDKATKLPSKAADGKNPIESAMNTGSNLMGDLFKFGK